MAPRIPVGGMEPQSYFQIVYPQSSTYLVEGVIITGYNRFAVQTGIFTQVFYAMLLVRIPVREGFEPSEPFWSSEL
jgi:hypothetical protein